MVGSLELGGGCARGSRLGDPHPQAEAQGGAASFPSALDSPRIPVVVGEGASPLPIMPEPGSFLSFREKSPFLGLSPAVAGDPEAEARPPGALEGRGVSAADRGFGREGARSSAFAFPPPPTPTPG